MSLRSFNIVVVFLLIIGCHKNVAEGTKVEMDYKGFFDRGFKKLHAGDNLGAIEDFNKAVKLNKIFTDGYYWRAVAKSNAGDSVGSCKDYQKAQELGDKNAQHMLDKYCNENK